MKREMRGGWTRLATDGANEAKVEHGVERTLQSGENKGRLDGINGIEVI